MNCTFHIKNGRVIDSSRNIDRVEDVFIRGSRIIDIPEGEIVEAEEIIDASGCLVFPGLIDFHTHLNRYHSDFGLHTDLMTLPNGVTAAVDAGSTGAANFEGFYKDVVCSSDITIKSFLNVSSVGVITEQYVENPDPSLYDVKKIEYMLERYSAQLLGLKLRIGTLFTGKFGIEPVFRTKELAKQLGVPMCVHAVEPENPYDQILAPFEKGDILCHCFQSKGSYSILDQNGKVGLAAREARARGVIFDAASGRANYNFDVAQKAINDGFMPDVISTDVVAYSIYKIKVFSLLWIMSAYLAIGTPLIEVLRAVTATPAKLMRMEGEIGTLAPGALADVAIMKLRDKPVSFNDQFGNTVSGDKLFLPQATIKAGRIAYMQTDFMI